MRSLVCFLLSICALLSVSCSRDSAGRDTEALVIKVAAGKDQEWESAILKANSASFPFAARFEYIKSPKYEGKTVEEVLATLPPSSDKAIVFLADERTLASKNSEMLCVYLLDAKQPHLRVEAKYMAQLSNNLAIANMDYSEFVECAKKTGVLSGL